MGEFVKITIDGDERLAKKFSLIDLYFTNKLKKPLGKAGDLLLDKFDDNFNTEGKTLRKPWKALKASTVRQKAAMGYGSKGILERTGKLRKAFEKKVSRFKVRVFNDTPYYKYHQLGGKHLPQRQMIRSTENIKQDVIEIFRKDLKKILQR